MGPGAATPLPIPAHAQVTTFSSGELATEVLPFVGTHHRTAEEQDLVDEAGQAL